MYDGFLALGATDALMGFEVGWTLDIRGTGSEKGIAAGDDLKSGHVVIDGEHGGCEERPHVEDPPFGWAEEVDELRNGGDLVLHNKYGEVDNYCL